MLGYVMIGADDVPGSGRFYSAILGPLGYDRKDDGHGIVFSRPDTPDVYVVRPFDGRSATVGNGSMLAFRAAAHALVRTLHAAGIAAGGRDEGAPGFRADYSEHFYVAYLRDPVGNKLALFCNDPAEGRRGA
ncbi:VOC family protein [uncultured Reyranella sp.]|jgi:catechol 2,3-dioxygenase-like lactoylglutathione lyase family enzyme|uniref:VOC family protein n=1 Tax=uncultured Reyranella sp. TaxID=735512 RepID=UPI00259CFE08|nr:VOC family protein [uncultured Reyranella sp.]